MQWQCCFVGLVRSVRPGISTATHATARVRGWAPPFASTGRTLRPKRQEIVLAALCKQIPRHGPNQLCSKEYDRYEMQRVSTSCPGPQLMTPLPSSASRQVLRFGKCKVVVVPRTLPEKNGWSPFPWYVRCIICCIVDLEIEHLTPTESTKTLLHALICSKQLVAQTVQTLRVPLLATRFAHWSHSFKR